MRSNLAGWALGLEFRAYGSGFRAKGSGFRAGLSAFGTFGVIGFQRLWAAGL